MQVYGQVLLDSLQTEVQPLLENKNPLIEKLHPHQNFLTNLPKNRIHTLMFRVQLRIKIPINHQNKTQPNHQLIRPVKFHPKQRYPYHR